MHIPVGRSDPEGSSVEESKELRPSFKSRLSLNAEMSYTLRMNLRRALVCVGLLLALSYFFIRGPLRGMRTQGFDDFAGALTITHVWVQGLNCYSPNVVTDQWIRDGRPQFQFILKERNSTSLLGSGAGLPGSVPLLAPFTLLPAVTADQVWIWFSAAATLAMLFALFRTKNFIFLAFALALAPLHTGIATGNASILVIACVGFSYLWRFQRPILAGVLLGIAGSFKPHIAGAGLLFFLVEQTWTPVIVSVLTGLLSIGLFAGRLAIAHVPWWSGFIHRTVAIGYHGGPDDFSLANSARYQLVNLQVLFASVLSNRSIVNILAISITVGLVALWAYWMRGREVAPILGFAAINVILLLPSYHRFYDAGVIAFALAAAAALDRYRWIVPITLAAFLAPIPAALVHLGESGEIPLRVLQSKLIVVFVLCHEIWILLALAVFFLVLMRNRPLRRAHGSREVPVLSYTQNRIDETVSTRHGLSPNNAL